MDVYTYVNWWWTWLPRSEGRGFWMAGQHLAVPQPYLSILGRRGSRAGLGWVVM